MLVITRNPKQCLRIGDEIQITVTKVVGDAVYLGITAPKEISVVQSEPCKKPNITFKKSPRRMN